MRNTIAGIRRHYGANPLNLLVLLGCFALASYAVSRITADPTLPRILLWFAAALIAHDLILFPLYALADRSLTGALTRIRARGRHTTTSFVSLRNHIRIPALGSALLLVVYLPGIIRQGQATYLAATGQTQQPYPDRWLLLTAALFTLSAISYAIRLARSPRPIRPTPPTEHPAPPDNAPTERAPTGALPTAGLLVLVLATLIFRILRHLRSNPNTHRPSRTTPKMVAPQRKRRG